MKIGKALTVILVVLILIQLIPGPSHENPPVTGTPQWDSPRTAELFKRACANCHSNETVWPWYSTVAPLSWIINLDVSVGRSKLNVSEWGRTGKNDGDEAAGALRKGKMPPWFYMPAHPEAKLTAAEKDELVNGLVATFGDEEAEKEKKEIR
ncbi:heme-binding domain-containing protein [Chlorobaculum sp. 24CR]|uniref:heme-binding domain-containing protein n=1 Tax=Chlorobaculum sp. 24CR TaxID=2508878 RepID=UPI00142F86F3|nr:heme-binding domain-containing protein [Chlorobaculum sp. 24CR]